VKYLILIQTNPRSRQAWEALSEPEQREVGRRHLAYRDRLDASGELLASEALAYPSETRRVRVRDGTTVVTDGPFAEAKEQLAGFYLVQCESMDRAVALAALAPDAEHGLVEVRPVLNLTGRVFLTE